jgi:hypothetical protein
MTMLSEQVHKFNIGHQVKLRHSRISPVVPRVYEVTRLLPPENNDFQYRIRMVDGRVDRVVFESELA